MHAIAGGRRWNLFSRRLPYIFNKISTSSSDTAGKARVGRSHAVVPSSPPLSPINLPNGVKSLTDHDRKAIMKILKSIGSGCRRLLRLAAEVQHGPLGINLRQHTIREFFKPIHSIGVKTPKTYALQNKKKNKNIIELNKNLNPYDIFYTTPSMTINDVLYWEFKAG